MSLTSDEEETLPNKVQWIDFKQQFFSSILISEQPLSDVELKSNISKKDGYLKDAYAEIPLAYNGSANEQYNMQFFFGPNSYKVLKEYGDHLDLPDVINMGWKWIAWFNKYFVIPIFNFLEHHTALNYGIIILLLTLIIKIILFPLTYKSYMSQARMRVLKPQVDEIAKKYPADKAMERQQATMKLYKQAGVNPMGGCLPMLIQMPILIALFYFFPGAIELRQQSFLWAPDLSTYDDVINWGVHIPLLGDHLSLFCLLFSVSNIINTYIMMKQQDTGANPQMAAMKWMMYLMPVMFIFIFNSYSSGLNYYYFISGLISIIIMMVLRKTTDEAALLAKLEARMLANKNNPKKRSGMMEKLAALQKEQERMMREREERERGKRR